MLLLQVESLGTFLLPCSVLLRLTVQFFEAFLHEVDCAVGRYGALLVDGPFNALHILDVLLAEGLQGFHVGKVCLQLLNDWDHVCKAAHSHVRFLFVGLVAPLRTLTVDLNT